MRRALTTLAFAAAVMATGAPRADDAPTAAAAPETVLLKAAHVFDSTGTALRDGVSVIVRGDRIVSIGTAAAPAGARVIDLGDATLLPGFIDAHTHLTVQIEATDRSQSRSQRSSE